MPETNYNEVVPVQKVRFSPEISLGQAIQALLLFGGLAMGAQVWLSQTSNNTRDLETLKKDVTAQFASQKIEVAAQVGSLQVNMNDQFKTLQLTIANIPDMRAEVNQLGRRADGFDNRLGAQSDRMSKFETMLFQMSARQDNYEGKTPGRH